MKSTAPGSVAIIGAGPAGLAAARYLKSEGFQPVIFEQSDKIGGQWSGDRRYSGIWPSMRTNTSHVMTAFSDLRHQASSQIYPGNQAIGSYLQRYAEKFDLKSCLQLKTTVRQISRDTTGSGWIINAVGQDGILCQTSYSHVVIATGRYRKFSLPAIPGIAEFTGHAGVIHTFNYDDADKYRGLKVLVLGCSISALEIASEIAMRGAQRVLSSYRRQRYILSKILAGVPTEHIVFTRFAALSAESLPLKLVAQQLKDFILATSGSPEQFGAMKPAANVLEAGITQSQHFLPLVAEGRIETRPFVKSIDGQTINFEDGHSESVDAIVCGTGYKLDLDFLSSDLQNTLRISPERIDLYKSTFHPDLPGLAFLGFLEVLGPYFPVLELQARWIAYVYSGAATLPAPNEMRLGLNPQHILSMQTAAIMYARAAGVEPHPLNWPLLTRALYFGPLSPMSFRLSGRDSLPEAAEQVAEDARAFGAILNPELSSRERMQLQALASARKDTLLAQFIARSAESTWAGRTMP